MGRTRRGSGRPSRDRPEQVDLGLDVIDDGELGKPGFIHYMNERLGGFEPG